MNIIHINFRNIIALNQLREYLEMGICDTLEGPHGAYAQYLMDIRTERICSSIQDLKESLVDALNKFSATQGALLQELSATHSAISKMEQSISSGLVNLGASMRDAQFASGNRIEACLSDATAQIGKIEKSISTASYNQYIALRHTNIDNYLLRHPSV